MTHKNHFQESKGLIQANRKEIICAWRQKCENKTPNLIELFGPLEFERFLNDIVEGLIAGMSQGGNLESGGFQTLLDVLAHFSKEMTLKNVPPTDAATLIFSLKEVVFPQIEAHAAPDLRGELVLGFNHLVDQLGLFTFDTYVQSKEQIIREQQKALFDVSVPVVRLWDRILLLPLIGMIDSNRTQLMMETLLTAIEETQSRVALIDISGIPIVDSLVARHLILTVTAAKLMGAECIITGISSRISQTVVNLGADLSGVVTRSSLADGLQTALEITEQKIG